MQTDLDKAERGGEGIGKERNKAKIGHLPSEKETHRCYKLKTNSCSITYLLAT